MPIIAVVVGAIGSAVGTALGVSTALGATIGAAVGAGIAGGILSSATGGDFKDGFLKGAVIGATGSLMRGSGIGDMFKSEGSPTIPSGATQFADGTTTAQMLAEQGGAEFAPDALSGMGDLGATGTASGLGELGAGGMSSTGTGDLFDTGMGEIAPTMSTAPTAEGGFSLGNLTSTPTPGADSFSLSSMPTDTTSSAIGFTPTPSLGTDQFALTPGMTSEAPLLSTDYAPTMGGTEGAAPTWAGDTGGIPTAGSYPMDYQESITPQPQQSSGGLGGMFKSSDAWLKNTFGQSAPSTGKLLLAGGQALYDKYQTDKLERQSKGLAPMSFEEYQRQFSNVDDYRNASARMAQSGRTGTLPALLARMKERTRAGYAGYLPGAQQQYLGTQADIAGARSRSLSNLFRNVVA